MKRTETFHQVHLNFIIMNFKYQNIVIHELYMVYLHVLLIVNFYLITYCFLTKFLIFLQEADNETDKNVSIGE